MQHLIRTRIGNGVDWLASSKLGRRLTYAGMVAVSVGICLAAVWPDAGFVPGWQPATAVIMNGGTEVVVGGKNIGFLKGVTTLPQTIWVLLTKKAAYYEVQRPITGHYLLVAPIVITVAASVAAAVMLAVFLARHRSRFYLPG